MQLESIETATPSQRQLADAHKRRRAEWEATARDRARGKTIPIILAEPGERRVVVNAEEANLLENWTAPETDAEKVERIITKIKALAAELKELSVKQSLLSDKQVKQYRWPVDQIQKAVGVYCGVSRGDMLSARRTRNVVRPRQIAMYLCKKLTLRSLPEIGRKFGGRDHTTVLHAVRKIESLRQSDPIIREQVEYLESLFSQASQ